MIQHTYERALKAKALDALIVATDDLRIKEAVEGFGGRATLTSLHCPSGTDRVAEVVSSLSCDLAVNIQADEPLIAPATIDEAIAPFLADDHLQMGTVCRRIVDPEELHDPHVVKVVFDVSGFALYFSRASIPYYREGLSPSSPSNPVAPVSYKHIGLYVYRRDVLLQLAHLQPTPLETAEGLEQLRALEHGIRVRVVETPHDSIGIDTPEDLEWVRQLMEQGSRDSELALERSARWRRSSSS